MKKNKLFSLLIAGAMLLVSGCDSENAVNDTPKKEKYTTVTPPPLPETKYDIFNLTWGMDKDECYRICDWGGKLEKEMEVKYPSALGTHLLKFEKGKLYTSLKFNENNRLYGAEMYCIYQDKEFTSAQRFYYYLNKILSGKYKRVYDDFNSRYFGLTDSVLYKHFLNNEVTFAVCYESTTTEITLLMIPSTVSNSLDIEIILNLGYKSKTVKDNSLLQPDKSIKKDAVGL